MPIECAVEVSPSRQERFHAVDKILMGHVFDIHNTMGRFFDERIYQEELAKRCKSSGIQVNREVELRVFHHDFLKQYYIDLFFDGGFIYELKTVETLNPTHQRQLIHYLLLTGLNHGKLINFRPGSIESRFVSTRLNRIDRMTYQIDEQSWRGDDRRSQILKETLHRLLEDWGAFLEISLYREALLHFTVDKESGIQPVDIVVNGKVVGSQNMCLLDSGCAWHLSAARIHLGSYETHMKRLLHHTHLKSIHWINFNQRKVTIKTLEK